MTFEWDVEKNRANIRKHGLDFADAAEMFRSALAVEPDIREDYGESDGEQSARFEGERLWSFSRNDLQISSASSR